MRNLSWLGVWSLVALFGSTPPAPAEAAGASPDYLPVAAIQPGMTGYGLTVFRGSRIDTFSVEVVGIQHAARPSGSLILVEVGGHGLEQSSIAQGMSGSPIFLEGKLAGALAFGWPGALRPLGGVTPAEEMLALPTALPAAEAEPRLQGRAELLDLVAGAPAGLARRLLGSVDSAPDRGRAEVAAPWPVVEPRLAATWPDPRELVASLLGPALPEPRPAGLPPQSWVIQPVERSAGPLAEPARPQSGATFADPALSPGSACAIPLITGDAVLGVTGTVTWVAADRVYLMGHPFLQRGPVALPLATAEVLTVFPSRQMSFKMASVGEIVGTVHHDQRAGLTGRLGQGPQLIPVKVEISRPGDASAARKDLEYRFDVVADPVLTPPLVFWSLYNALLAVGDDQSQQTVRYEVATTWSGPPELVADPLVLSGVVAGPQGVQGLAAEWMAPLSILLNNPFARLQLLEVSARLEVTRPMATATIVGLAGPRLMEAGQKAGFRVELHSRHAGPEFVDFEVQLPEHLPAGTYRLAAASAAEFFALEAQRAAGRFQLSSLGNALDLLRTDRSQAKLQLALFAPGTGLVMRGRELAGLPGTVANLLRAGDPEATPALADYLLRLERSTGKVLQGHAIQTIRIQPAAAPAPGGDRP